MQIQLNVSYNYINKEHSLPHWLYDTGRFIEIIKFVANHFPLNDSHLSPQKLLAETELISMRLRSGKKI